MLNTRQRVSRLVAQLVSVAFGHVSCWTTSVPAPLSPSTLYHYYLYHIATLFRILALHTDRWPMNIGRITLKRLVLLKQLDGMNVNCMTSFYVNFTIQADAIIQLEMLYKLNKISIITFSITSSLNFAKRSKI